MTGEHDPVLSSVVSAALEATGAGMGWLLATSGAELVVRAVAGTNGNLIGARVPVHSGFAGYVASSGQPLAMSPRRDDERGADGVAALVGARPRCVLAVPCTTGDEVNGVLELIDKGGDAPFTFDDVELAMLLAGIASTALQAPEGPPPVTPTPEQLGRRLASLAVATPERYVALANFLAVALGDG